MKFQFIYEFTEPMVVVPFNWSKSITYAVHNQICTVAVDDV